MNTSSKGKEMNPLIPADVPSTSTKNFQDNYAAITRNSDKLLLFACDQKIEHLNADFVPPAASPDARHPEHLFTIATEGTIGAMAAHVGLIARYAPAYPGINFIAKLNGKTPLLSGDPLSAPLYTVEDALALQEQGVAIRGIGLTCYLGSEHENQMLSFAAESISQAHHHGLVTLVWMYLRGKVITDEQDPALLAGAAGVANTIGTDFVKLKPPREVTDVPSIVTAAGNSGVIFSGQERQDGSKFLHAIHAQLKQGARGTATGRNIFQRSRPEGISMTHALSALVHDGATPDVAIALLKSA